MSGEYLQDTDYSLLCKELKKVSDWYSLGVYFGISESVLKRIEADHPSVRRRKQEVCAAFIRSNTSASWEIVIYALNEMDEKRLARKIERKYSVKQKPAKLPSQLCARESSSSSSYLSECSSIGISFSGSEPMDSYDFSPSYRCGCRNCSIFKICDDGCPNPDKDAVLPVLNETTAVVTSLHHFHLEAQRQRETKQMMTTFANFAYETCESMKKKVTVEKFTVWLKQLEAFDKVSHCSESTSALLAQRINEISQAGSMEQVFLILSDYWSWYNHYLVEEIVNTFGDQDDQRRLDDFKENFSTFAQNRIGEFSQHEMSLGAAGGDKKRRPLLFKVDKIWDNIHINQLPDIHQNLASILGVNPHTLYFASIRQGCILMEFLIPSSVAQAVFPLSSSQKEALAAASVMQVLCGTHSYKFLASSTPQIYNFSGGFIPYPVSRNTPSISISGSQNNLQQPFNRSSYAKSGSKYNQKLSEERESKASQIFTQRTENLSADGSRMSPVPTTMTMPPGSPNHLPPKTTAIPESVAPSLIGNEILRHVVGCLIHREDCQIPRCPCRDVQQRYHELLIKDVSAAQEPPKPPPYDNKKQHLHLSLSQQNLGSNEHPHWHLHTKSHIRRTQRPPLLRQRSQSVDLTPIIEMRETPVIEKHRYQTSSTGHGTRGRSPLRLPETVVTETLC